MLVVQVRFPVSTQALRVDAVAARVELRDGMLLGLVSLLPGSLVACRCRKLVGHGDRVRRVLGPTEHLGAGARPVDGYLLKPKGQGAHELGPTCRAYSIAVPIRLVLDVDVQHHLVQGAYAGDADVEVALKVARVLRRPDKLLHFEAQQLNVLKGRVVRDFELDGFHNGFAADVVDPEC